MMLAPRCRIAYNLVGFTVDAGLQFLLCTDLDRASLRVGHAQQPAGLHSLFCTDLDWVPLSAHFVQVLPQGATTALFVLPA